MLVSALDTEDGDYLRYVSTCHTYKILYHVSESVMYVTRYTFQLTRDR